jgi:membrane fusion protein (multidrug efflux system)
MVGEGDKVVSRPIAIIESYQHRFVVSSGLKEGDKIIVEGLQRAKAGSTVKPVMTSSETGKKQPAASG